MVFTHFELFCISILTLTHSGIAEFFSGKKATAPRNPSYVQELGMPDLLWSAVVSASFPGSSLHLGDPGNRDLKMADSTTTILPGVQEYLASTELELS